MESVALVDRPGQTLLITTPRPPWAAWHQIGAPVGPEPRRSGRQASEDVGASRGPGLVVEFPERREELLRRQHVKYCLGIPQSSTVEADAALGFAVDDTMLEAAATAQRLLLATFGPGLYAFVKGVRETNQLMEADLAGLIYTPMPPTEKSCPWDG